MAPPSISDKLMTLQATIKSCRALLQSFRETLQSPSKSNHTIPNPPNPLAVLRDTSRVLSAQTTKLSLLVLNKPFTPSAIGLILKSLSNECLPAMMSAIELCPAVKYSELLHNHVKISLVVTFTELDNLLASIPSDEHGIETARRGVLASTGTLWAECNKMIEVATNGLVGLARGKVEEYHGLFKDCIDEIEDWDSDDEDMDCNIDSFSTIDEALKREGEDEGSVKSLGGLNLDLGECRKRILVHLRLLRVLYPALQKRRIATFSNISSASDVVNMPSEDRICELDCLVTCSRQWTDTADEVAGSLYDGKEVAVERRLHQLRDQAAGCVKRFQRNWDGHEDEFTIWSEKWLARLKDLGKADTK